MRGASWENGRLRARDRSGGVENTQTNNDGRQGVEKVGCVEARRASMSMEAGKRKNQELWVVVVKKDSM